MYVRSRVSQLEARNGFRLNLACGGFNIEREITFWSALGQHNSYSTEPQVDLQDFIKRFTVMAI